MITKKRIIAAMLAAPAALLFAAPASAQVAGGIATASPLMAIGNSKAYASANQQIDTAYKAAFDQIDARRAAAQKEVEPFLTAIDTNKDKQISDAEVAAAQAAKNPALDRIKAAQDKAQTDIQQMSLPVIRAQAFAIENILRQYGAAQGAVVNAKKITVILTPEAFVYAPPAVDVTPAITAELDKALPTVSIAPPATWQPSREALGLQQQLQQLDQRRAEAAAQQAAARPAGAAPAGAPPATRPAT
ncbi:MAG: OmpH family outer membrane protein, partial [Pseudomonadota bacterium]